MEEKSAVCGTEHLGICFESVTSQGKLTTCPHLFHYRCILQWSKVCVTQIANLCPTCRVPFLEIRMYRKGVFVKSIAVERRQNNSSEDSAESPEVSESESEDWRNRCQVCGGEDPAGLILCDGEDGECTNAYHFACVGLPAIPRGRWLCAECQSLEEYRRAHPEEFTLCASSESDDSSFADPGSESSGGSDDEDGSFHEESEGVVSTEAQSKPQSFVVSDDESDPSDQYRPPEESESESSEEESYQPETREKPTIPPRRNVRSMTASQRAKYIKKNLDPDYTPEDPIDQAWLIYRTIKHPRKRLRQRFNNPQSPPPETEPKKMRAVVPAVKSVSTPETYKKFVTEIVQNELSVHFQSHSEELAAKIHRRQTVAK